MPASATEPGSARDWLRHAKGDLAMARLRKTPSLLYEHLCFHAQQAAEKSIKAVLVHFGIPVPRSHDLAYLLERLPDGLSIPPTMLELPTLTKYAVQQRYPGDVPALTFRHRRHALRLAEAGVAWAVRVTEP